MQPTTDCSLKVPYMSLAPVLSLVSGTDHCRRLARFVTAASMVCTLTLAGGSAWSQTSASEEVSRLLEQGKLSEAAKRAQSHLKQNANDVQMRFLQGVIAAEQRKYDQAIQVFTSLTQDYPDLPEPYNNLAVLHAAKGEERKAAQVLEQAIRTNPSYATAHENLGDLYARMASDAYAKALQLDGSRQAIQPKLSLIKQIFPTSPVSGAVTAAVVPPSTAPAVTVTQAAPGLKPTSTPALVTPPPAKTAEATPPAASSPRVEPERKLEPESKPAVAVAKEQSKADDSKRAVAAVEKAVAAWAKAWENQDMNAYYAAYSSQFDPQGSSLTEWKTERKARIVGKPAITVEVRNLKVAIQGDRADASFRQHYASGGYKASTRKTLRMQREGEKWRIIREETGR